MAVCHSDQPNQEMVAAVYLNSSPGQWAGFQMCYFTSLQSINKRRRTDGMLTFVQKIAQRVKEGMIKAAAPVLVMLPELNVYLVPHPHQMGWTKNVESLFSPPFCHEERYSKAEQIYVVEADPWRHIQIVVCRFLGVYVSRHSGAASAI